MKSGASRVALIWKSMRQELGDVVLLLLGGGNASRIPDADGLRLGVSEWEFTSPIDLLFDSGTGLADFHCQQLLGDCYRRLTVNTEQNIGLNAVDKTNELIELADAFDLEPTLQFIDGQWPKPAG